MRVTKRGDYMTPEQLARATGSTVPNAALYASHLTSAMRHFGITQSQQRISMFLAQIAFESGRLSRVEENLSYSAQRLMQVWPRRFPTLKIAEQYAFNPQKLAEFVYGGRMGNIKSGDGWKYRGRGLKQLTGADNYLAAELELGRITGDLYHRRPELVAMPKGAAWTAAWFWGRSDLNRIADSGNYTAITRVINGGLTGHEDGNSVGMDDRVEYYNHVRLTVSKEPEGSFA